MVGPSNLRQFSCQLIKKVVQAHAIEDGYGFIGMNFSDNPSKSSYDQTLNIFMVIPDPTGPLVKGDSRSKYILYFTLENDMVSVKICDVQGKLVNLI